jgi:glutaredoxin-like YruB-family protein
MAKEIKVYTTRTCPWCVRLKEFLQQNGVDYIERHVDTDDEALAEFNELDVGRGVPVTVIDGQVVKGFDQARLRELL